MKQTLLAGARQGLQLWLSTHIESEEVCSHFDNRDGFFREHFLRDVSDDLCAGVVWSPQDHPVVPLVDDHAPHVEKFHLHPRSAVRTTPVDPDHSHEVRETSKAFTQFVFWVMTAHWHLLQPVCAQSGYVVQRVHTHAPSPQIYSHLGQQGMEHDPQIDIESDTPSAVRTES